MARNTFHVVPVGDGWAVKKEGNERPTSSHDTQKAAIDSAREAAQDGDEIIVHRADGSIREHTTYSGGSSNGAAGDSSGARRSDRPEARDVWSVGTRVRWSPILAGVVAALAISVLLTALAAAIGLTTMQNMRPSTVGTIAGVTFMIIMVVSLFVGGYIATQVTTRETQFEAVLIGVLVWGATLAVSTLSTFLGSNLALDATRTASAIGQQRPFWEDMGWNEQRMQERMGSLSPDEQRRFDDYKQRTRNTLQDTNPRAAAWWLFAGMAISLSACIGGALVGAGPDVSRRLLRHDTTGEPLGGAAARNAVTV